MRVVDKDGKILSVGKEGAVEVKSPWMFSGYRDMPEATIWKHSHRMASSRPSKATLLTLRLRGQNQVGGCRLCRFFFLVLPPLQTCRCSTISVAIRQTILLGNFSGLTVICLFCTKNDVHCWLE